MTSTVTSAIAGLMSAMSEATQARVCSALFQFKILINTFGLFITYFDMTVGNTIKSTYYCEFKAAIIFNFIKMPGFFVSLLGDSLKLATYQD